MIAHDEEENPLGFPAALPELSALYPKRASAEWDALAAGIMRAAAPELARRRTSDGRASGGLAGAILRLARPVGLAAAAVLLFGAIGLAVTSDAEASVTAAAPTFAEVVDAEPASTLLAADRPPSASDLANVLEGDSFPQVRP